MSEESVERLYDDIMRIIDYYRNEFDISYSEAIGILTIITLDLHSEITLPEGEDNGESIEEGD